MTKFLKKISSFLILGSFLVLSALLPEILGEDAKILAESYLGENYQYILVAFFLLLFLFAAYINPEIGMGLFSRTDKSKPERYNIPPTDENHELLRKAKVAIAKSNPEQALELLATLKLKTLDIEITALSARLADLERTQRFGTESYDTETREHNKINKSIILLITALETEIAQSFEFYDKIRAALKSRYETRLSQKLSNRQPVNLRLVPSTVGTTPQAANTFVQYSEGEIRGKLAEYYKDANGRLLLVGVPGAGKTTLLLQLELELLEQETTRIPVILNLARWSSEFSTLEAWIQEILPSEMGLTINKKMAGDLIAQNRLILLLDGLDEVKAADRQTCLEAIGVYGEDSSRFFVLSSRIDEYKSIAKDAPVNGQVEVGILAYEQLIAQLEKIEKNEGSKRLLAALKEDELLREIVKVPFYFNVLQTLFAKGKFLHEFNFHAKSIKGRRKEVEKHFINNVLSGYKRYSSSQVIFFLSFYSSRINREKILDFELIDLQYNWANFTSLDLFCGSVLKMSIRIIAIFIILIITSSLILQTLKIISYSDFTIFKTFIDEIYNGIMEQGVGDFIGKFLFIVVGVGLLGSFLLGGVINIISIINRNRKSLNEGIENLVEENHEPFDRDKSFNNYLAIESLDALNLNEFIWALWRGWINSLIPVGFFFVALILVLAPLKKSNIPFNQYLYENAGVLFCIYIILVIFMGVFPGAAHFYENSYYSLIQINTPYQRFKASAKLFYFSILQYYHLCYLLNRKGLLPFRLVPFLNDMVKCNILETTGASWRFRHRILQDYFADQWVETEFEIDQEKNTPTDQANSPAAL